MEYMFYSASVFNQPIGQWDVSKVTNMQYMFQSAPAFAQSLESWPETTSTLATNWYGPTYEMFNGATAFRSKFSCPSGNFGPPVKCTCTLSCPLSDSVFTTQIDICLQASPVHGLCSDSAPKYGAMPDWDVSEVTNMSHAFRDLASFDADLSKWEVSQVTDMEYMFHGASSFSSDISAWDTSRVTNMQNMFHGASSFRSSVSDWKVRLQPVRNRTCFWTLRLLFLAFYAETLRAAQHQRVLLALHLHL